MAEPNANASGTPASLGPWTIQSQVGAGGMGVVYRATRDDRVAALKVIRPGLLDDQAVQARFAREVEVLRRVRDVHISEFLDADLTSEPAWLATAFIDGPNLRDFVSQRGPLPTSVWWDLARGLSQALAVLEVHGITHRDLKPANVILADHGPVLIDFGIAVPEDAASLTGTGLVTGSPSWLSPEQANLQPISTASDVFSLGSLLAFAGTGRPPFGQGAHVAVLLAIASRDPDIVGLDEAQQRLLRHMMAKNPAERPTARQVLAWTKRGPSGIPPLPEAFGAGEATTVMTGAAAATQVMQPPAVGPLTAPQQALQATTAVPPTVPASAAVPPAAQQPAAPPSEPRRSGLRVFIVIAVVLAVAVAAVLWFNRGSGGTEGGSDPQETTAPTPGPTPSAPAEDQVARSGDFQLAGWQIANAADGTMSVQTTVRNTGDAAASGFATVFIYADGVAIGSASGELPEIPAGGSVDVTFVGQDEWQPGQKSVSLEVQ